MKNTRWILTGCLISFMLFTNLFSQTTYSVSELNTSKVSELYLAVVSDLNIHKVGELNIAEVSELNINKVGVLKVSADGSQDYTTITSAIAAASNGDVIEVYGTITNDGVDTIGIVVDKNLTIRGHEPKGSFVEGSRKEMDENINKRVFTIKKGVTVTLKNLTIRNGYLQGQEVPDKGAAIKNQGILILANCEVSQNYVERNCCIFEGGIFNEGTAITAFDKWTPQNQKIIVSCF